MSAIPIRPARRVRGETSVPGDKSVSHRLAMIASIARGTSRIDAFSAGADCASTLDCLEQLGVLVRRDPAGVTIEGCGLYGLCPPGQALDAGNSGTTVRLLSGILAGQPFESLLVGDDSLSRRPMRRVLEPLRRLGAELEARDGDFLPLRIRGGRLVAIDYALPVASAQVKSAVLFAGALAQGVTRVRESDVTRNHTEIALENFGARLRSAGQVIEIDGGSPLTCRNLMVPGDLSSAAFSWPRLCLFLAPRSS